MTDNTLDKEIDEIFEEYYTSSSMHRLDTAKSKLKSLILKDRKKMLEFVIGSPIELRADIDDELKEYVPDMEERSLEVTGVPSSFTNLFTRAIIKSVQERLRQRAKEWSKR